MAPKLFLICAALLPLSAGVAIGQQAPAPAPAPSVPLVQPGAPGQPSTTLTGPTVGTAVRTPTVADVKFMQGMIMHHGQAIEMTDLMQGHSSNPQLMEFAQRISLAQSSEILFMKSWLNMRGFPLEDNSMAGMAGMDMSSMPGMKMAGPTMSMPLMPGMLSPEQMDALRKSKGPEFDHLFLTGMIQHHGGALIMVNDLFTTPGAGQDNVLFDFATDIDNTQRAEIRIMQAMLKEKK